VSRTAAPTLAGSAGEALAALVAGVLLSGASHRLNRTDPSTPPQRETLSVMTASFFSTILTADARTNPDRTGAQYAPSMTQRPRVTDGWTREAWASVHVNAEQAIQIAAQTVADTPMEGLTGDHPDKRQQIVAVLDATAAAVRALAMDAGDNGALSQEQWQGALDAITRAVSAGSPDAEGRRAAQMQVIDPRDRAAAI
jgi:hypothetical protein